MATRKLKKTTSRKKTAKKHKTPPTGIDIQKQVRDLMLDVISERNLHMDQLTDLAETVLEGATAAIKDALPASRKSALQKVLHGIDEAWAATAEASISSVRHAKRYGLRLAQKDITDLGKRLNSLERQFVNTLDQHARKLGGDLGRELTSLSGQMKKAGTQIRPAAQAAQKAITEHGASLAREITSTGAKVGRQAIRGILLTASGVLEGTGKAAAGKNRTRPKSR